MSLTLELNRRSHVPLFKQIYQGIVDKIDSCLLEEGQKLPSIRDLAKELRVSPETVVRAYKLLEEKQYIKQIQGKGSYVRTSDKTARKRHTADWQLTVPDYLPRSRFLRHREEGDHSRYPFSVCTIYPRLFPNATFSQLIRKEIERNPKMLTEYGSAQGDPELRECVCRYLASFGIRARPDQILIVNGSQQGLELAAKTWLGPGDFVVTEAPTYPAVIDVFRSRGVSVLQVPVEADGIRIDLLEELIDKYHPKMIYTVPTFQNPTGTTMSLAKRKLLLEIAREHNILILEDDPWSETYFADPPPPSLKSMDLTGHVIYLKGSKVLAPGCRIGMVAAEGLVIRRLLAAKGLSDLGTPLLTQRAFLALLNWEKFRDHMKKLRLALSLRKEKVEAIFRKHLNDQISWSSPEGGLNIWMTLPEPVDTDALLVRALQKGVSFLPGSAFYPNEPETRHLRICFTSTDEQTMEEGLEKLCGVLNDTVCFGKKGGS
jgi:DNA-binding transcriptional MocR family regulator